MAREDFAPTVVMRDRRQPGSAQLPFEGFDQVRFPFGSGRVTELTMELPPSRLAVRRAFFIEPKHLVPPAPAGAPCG